MSDEQRQHIERVARTQLIDARMPTSFLGHSYFYRHPAVSADLILLLRDQLEPGSPGRPLHKRGSNFWQITPRPFAELKQLSHINARAQAAGDAPDFSQRIRADLPMPLQDSR